VRALFLAVAVTAACAAPVQNGGVVVHPGAVERFLLAMRLGYGGAGEARPSARVRRVALEGDLPTGAAATARRGDWLLENELVTAIVGDLGGPHAGQLVDVAPAPTRRDAFGGLTAQVAGGAIRYRSVKSGEDAATGSAWVQLSGYAEARPELQVTTRYDLAADLSGVLVHTSITGPEGPLATPLGVGDVAAFAASGGRIELGAHDAATIGGAAGYLLAPLGDPPFLVSASATGEATVGVAGARVEVAPREPYIYSRAVLVLERPDALALATTRAMATGQPVGEIELELVARLRAGESVDAGRIVFQRAGDDAPLELETRASRPGDRRRITLPVGSYRVTFTGGAWQAPSKRVSVGARVLTPVRLRATRNDPAPAPASAPVNVNVNVNVPDSSSSPASAPVNVPVPVPESSPPASAPVPAPASAPAPRPQPS
jgi:hypothetical protein